jgi:hypothetical protein
MKLRLGLAVVASLVSYSCYSDIVNGTTENAAASDINWVMANVLPQVSGLTVGSVVYRYTVEKQEADPFVVSVQNQYALGAGYTFRSTDNWSGLPGNTISKIVPVGDIPSAHWGNGSITSTGIGRITDPLVRYGYRYDTCAEPTRDAACPNYKLLLTPKVYQWMFEQPLYDPMTDAVVTKLPEEEDKPKKAIEKKKKSAKKAAKKAAESALLTAEAIAQANAFQAMNPAGFDAYTFTMNGGVYKETIKLTDAKLPDSRSGLLNTWSQQALHTKMVDSQFNLEGK